MLVLMDINFLNAKYRFCKDDKALIAGSEMDILKFLNIYDFKTEKNTVNGISKSCFHYLIKTNFNYIKYIQSCHTPVD